MTYILLLLEGGPRIHTFFNISCVCKYSEKLFLTNVFRGFYISCLLHSAGHVPPHPAVRVRAAGGARAAGAALPPPRARPARAAAPAGQHEPHHQLLCHQAQVYNQSSSAALFCNQT